MNLDVSSSGGGGRYLLRRPGRDLDLNPEGTGVLTVVSASGAKHDLRCDSTPVRYGEWKLFPKCHGNGEGNFPEIGFLAVLLWNPFPHYPLLPGFVYP